MNNSGRKASGLRWLAIALLLGLAALALYQLTRTPASQYEPEALLPKHQPPAQALPELPFVDVAPTSGLDFVHRTGALGERLLPETLGGGGGFLDFDQDGDQDILLVDSGPWPPQRKAGERSLFLYENNGSGQFLEVGAQLGLNQSIYGMGPVFADVEGDGDLDIFVFGLGENLLLLREGGRFVNRTSESGLSSPPQDWNSAAAFFDTDGDQDLDLILGHYVEWSADIDRALGFQLTGLGRAYGPPTAFKGTELRHFRNDGDAHFVDVTEDSGFLVVSPDTGLPIAKTLALLPLDVDDDADLDLFVANDTVQNFLFENQGAGKFVERAAELGLAFDRNGLATGAMGVDHGNFRNDTMQAVAVGNFANEMTSFYVGAPSVAIWSDDASLVGVGAASRSVLSFGVLFADLDLDSQLDLVQTNGHIEPDIGKVQASQTHAQATQIFWNCGTACATEFQVLAPRPGDALAEARVGRALASGDIEGDGDLDLLLVQNGGPVALLRNDQNLGHDWLRVRLRGNAPNLDAIGARVQVRQGSGVQTRWQIPTRSYLSQNEMVLSFGLGNGPVSALQVRWPDGRVTELAGPAVSRNQLITITHPDLAPLQP